jgi:N6-adenosine-specific RNA methylase IME4
MTFSFCLPEPNRHQRVIDKAQRCSAKLGTRLYNVIYADPPWRWEPRDRKTGLGKSADRHYKTMPTEEIKAFRVPAADDCVLFLWATVPMLPQALEVMAAWGFTYKTNFVWIKQDRIGTGYWNRNCHEHLLVGTRGRILAPAPSERTSSVICAAVTQHSEKPLAAYQLIEAYYPDVPRLEMFARSQRPGWDVCGNEVESDVEIASH